VRFLNSHFILRMQAVTDASAPVLSPDALFAAAARR
jgi:hypothetical protein